MRIDQNARYTQRTSGSIPDINNQRTHCTRTGFRKYSDGTVSPTDLTADFIEKFRKTTAERKKLGIAAPFETETGYLFANDLNTPERFETLSQLLLDRGHSEARVKKIMGANLLRLFSETWIN